MLAYHKPVCARAFGTSYYRAEIVRVLHSVTNDDERFFSLFLCGGGNILYARVFFAAGNGGNALMSVSSNRYVILLIMNVFLLVMGMFLDLTPAVLIFTPIFLPITRSIGMSDVQFGIMLIMNLGIGSVTPPVGSCLFVGCGVGKVKIEGVTKYIVPLFAAMVVALFLVTFIPAIALVVPYLCGLVPSLGWTM